MAGNRVHSRLRLILVPVMRARAPDIALCPHILSGTHAQRRAEAVHSLVLDPLFPWPTTVAICARTSCRSAHATNTRVLMTA